MQELIVSSEDILLEAEGVWKDSENNYRDACIRVGKLLADFVLARMREADGLPEAERIARRFTRESIIETAAERLGMKPATARMLISVSKVVDLFGDPSGLSYTTLRAFTVFIRRKDCVVTRKRHAKPGVEVTPSESETWVVKSVVGCDLKGLYQRAIEEGWTSVQTRMIISRDIDVHRQSGPLVGSHQKRSEKSYTDNDDYDIDSPKQKVRLHGQERILPFRTLCKDTDPKDLVDMVMEMISACPRAEEFKKLLVERLRVV